jgi:hypothetical protein
MTASRRLAILVAAGVVAISAMLIWRHQRIPLWNGLPTEGGAPMNLKIEVTSLLQGDPRWAEQHLGSTPGTLGAEGCTLCALAMALSSQGFSIDPPKLNALLAKHQGFTESGKIIWASVQKASDARFTVRVVDRPTHAMIDAQLTAKNPLLAKVLFQNRIWHWVLISGKEGNRYLITDPLGSGQAHETMVDFPRGIHAIRYLEKR